MKKKRFTHRGYREAIKAEVITAYGSVCKCCGVKELEFLTIDHVNRDGQHDRKAHPDFYRYLIKAGFPQNGYQVLCMSCNWAKRHRDECPHETHKREAVERVLRQVRKEARTLVHLAKPEKPRDPFLESVLEHLKPIIALESEMLDRQILTPR